MMKTKTYRQHSCTVHERRLQVPLDFRRPHDEHIEIFARQIVPSGGEKLPYLLFLQGGPGGAGPRMGDWQSSWVKPALERYQVVLLDQRGTGQSSPLSPQTLVGTDQEIADYLTLFLQRQIVEDAEILREALGVETWTTLGQSYGGFLTLTYLSHYPQSLRACLIAGGLPGLVSVDEIYRQTFELTARRNRTYFDQHGDDEKTIRTVAAHLADTEEFLPSGDQLTPTRLRTLGKNLGAKTAFDQFHYLWEGPFVTVRGQRRLSQQFLTQIGSHLQMGDHPLYAALQEAIYGPTSPGGTRWAADRLAAEQPGFELDGDPNDWSKPWYLSGEHMYRAVFAEDRALAPWLGAIGLLAERTTWEDVYLPEALASNEIPVAAAVYYDDIFVPRELSLQTGAAVKGAEMWITNEYQHDGLRAGGSAVFEYLHGMLPI